MVLRLRTLAASRFAFLLAILHVAVHPWVWIHAYSGLETPSLHAAHPGDGDLRPSRANLPSVGLRGLPPAPLTRPEGIVFASAGVVLFWHGRGAAPMRLALFAAAILAGCLYFLARWHYIHNAFPNPSYVKLHVPSWRILFGNLLDNFKMSEWYIFTVALVLLLAREASTRVFALCSLALMLFVFAPHAMAMNFADRFYFQLTLPVLLIFLLTEGVVRNARIAAMVLAVFVLGLSTSFLTYCILYFPALTRAQMDLGKRLAPFASNHTMLTGEAGVLPYYSGWVAYDFLGLGTNGFARRLPTEQQIDTPRPDPRILRPARPCYRRRPLPTRPRIAYRSGQLRSPRIPPPLAPAVPIRWFRTLQRLLSRRVPAQRHTPRHDEILSALEQNTRTSADTHFSIRRLLLQKYVPWQN